jgi:transposase
VKNDVRDARDLADLLRMGRLAEGWIAPPHLRQLRELVRYRAKLVALRSALKAQVHAVLAKEGVAVPMADLFGKQGMSLLQEVRLGTCYRMRIDSLVKLIHAYDHAGTVFTAAVSVVRRGARMVVRRRTAACVRPVPCQRVARCRHGRRSSCAEHW